MSVAIALLIFAEAAGTCGAVAADRLGGGAQLAPAILEFESQAESAELTLAGLSRPSLAASTEATIEADQPEADSATPHCKAIPAAIA